MQLTTMLPWKSSWRLREAEERSGEEPAGALSIITMSCDAHTQLTWACQLQQEGPVAHRRPAAREVRVLGHARLLICAGHNVTQERFAGGGGSEDDAAPAAAAVGACVLVHACVTH